MMIDFHTAIERDILVRRAAGERDLIPMCAVSGEAAGVAAAMTDGSVSLDVSKLQDELRKRGVKIHIDKI